MLLGGETVWERCARPLLVLSPSSSSCRSGPVHFWGVSDLLYQRPTLYLPHALFFTSKAAQWSEPRYEPRAGLLWAALLSEAERTKSAQRHGGESEEKSLFNLIRVPVHHQPSTPPPRLSSSIPASLLFHSHSFLPFLNISASFLFPLLLAQCNYGNGSPPPTHTLSWWISTSCPETGLIILLRVMFS